MRSNRRFPSVPAVACAVLLAACPAGTRLASAASDRTDILKSLSGVWQGRGIVQRSATAAAEPVSCRFQAGMAGDGRSLDLSYICLGIDLRVESTGTLAVSGDRFAVSLYTAGTDRRVEGTGVRNGNSLVLALEARHPETGKPVSSRLTMTLTGSATLANVLRATDPETGETFTAFDATFTR